MQVFRTVESFRSFRKSIENQGTIGFVPTMGALHKGHISLVERSVSQNTFTICSIFVNPTQFNNADDLAKYPRLEEQDLNLLKDTGVTAVFIPSVIEMYPAETKVQINFGSLEAVLEGPQRPGHFNGVALVVSKLMHIALADTMYLGEKDLQQCYILRQLSKDLFFPTEIEICPTVRESDGLAMSSRNLRLSPEARLKAAKIYQAILASIEPLKLKGPEHAKTIFSDLLNDPDFDIEFFEVVTTPLLEPVSDSLTMGKSYAVCVAVWLSGVRLIDNQTFTL